MRYSAASINLDNLIDQVIDELSDDRVDAGVEGLHELAKVWKSAGMTQQSFTEICTWIEHEAGKRSDSDFVHMKMGAALKKAREAKHGLIIH